VTQCKIRYRRCERPCFIRR